MTPPATIEIKSDGNTLTFKEIIKQKDGLIYRYQYSKSKCKKGLTLDLDEQQLLKLINTNS